MDVVKDLIVHGNEQGVKKWLSSHGKNAFQMVSKKFFFNHLFKIVNLFFLRLMKMEALHYIMLVMKTNLR